MGILRQYGGPNAKGVLPLTTDNAADLVMPFAPDAAVALPPATPIIEPSLDENQVLAPTLFHQPWWLEIATHGRYQVVEARQDGRTVGRLPFVVTKRYGHSVSLMPTLTHFLGPAIDDGVGGANARFLRRLTITQELVQQLPKVSYLKHKLHRGVADTLPFQIAGYQSSVQFTYEIAPQPAVAVWQGMRDKTRNMVRKARRTMVCEDADDPDFFIDLYRSNLAAKGASSNIDLQTCLHLIAGCFAKNCGRILVARHSDRTVAAAIFYAWDSKAAYYLLSTRTPSSGNSANTLLLWEAIKDTMARGLVFDFDGVGSSGAVLFFAGFGTTIQPRYIISRSGKVAQVLQDIRLLLGYPKSTFY